MNLHFRNVQELEKAFEEPALAKGQYYDLISYRRIDYDKIDQYIRELWEQLHQFNPEFEYNINKIDLM